MVNVGKITKNGEKWWFFKICQKNGEMLKNVGENIKKIFYCTDHLLHSGY